MSGTDRQRKRNKAMNKNFRESVLDEHPELANKPVGVTIRRHSREKRLNVWNGKPAPGSLYLFGVSRDNRSYFVSGWVLGTDKVWKRVRFLEENGDEKWAVDDRDLRPLCDLYNEGYKFLGIEDAS